MFARLVCATYHRQRIHRLWCSQRANGCGSMRLAADAFWIDWTCCGLTDLLRQWAIYCLLSLTNECSAINESGPVWRYVHCLIKQTRSMSARVTISTRLRWLALGVTGHQNISLIFSPPTRTYCHNRAWWCDGQ